MGIPFDRCQQNIVLTGFMGVGKTTTGLELAAILNRRFVDTDAVIVERVGKSIASIFEEDGEPVFRAMERELCTEFSEQKGLIIAAGGGMIIDPVNQALLEKNGFLVCLDAPVDIIEARLAESSERPLAANWRERFFERREAYAAIPVHIDVTDKTPHAIAREIIAKWQC